MHINKTIRIITFFYLVLSSQFVVGQYSDIAKQIQSRKGSIFSKRIQGTTKNILRNGYWVTYFKSYSNELNFKYSADGVSNYFIINNQTINLQDSIDMFINELDPNSFVVYKFYFQGKKYFVLETLSSIPGKSIASSVIFYLFRFESGQLFTTHVWSKYGSINCFGDFDNDGDLNFLKIRSKLYNENINKFEANYLSYDSNRKQFIKTKNSPQWEFSLSDDYKVINLIKN